MGPTFGVHYTVYTSYRWLRQLLIEDGVVVSYCERGAKDNPKNP